MLSKEVLSQKFTTFAKNECKGSSELYEVLALEIAKDNELLELCTNVRNGQPVPNLLLGAVHYLLLKGFEHKLKDFYPSIEVEAKPPNNSFEYFKEFCLINKNELIHLLQTKLVQTNEVRRCAYLYPVFSFIYEKTKKPLALLNLMMHPDGPSPRFGSCYFLLSPKVSYRSTYTYLDSHQNPKEKGYL